jgi:ABC-type glycerol-3-phosphate transport system substrate-binding protein
MQWTKFLPVRVFLYALKRKGGTFLEIPGRLVQVFVHLYPQGEVTMKRILFIWLVFVSLILSACGASPVTPAPEEATTAPLPAAAEYPGEAKLTVWTHDQLYIDYFNSRIAEWEALHPTTKFTYDFVVDSQAPTNALNAIAAGEPGPDLLGIEQGSFPNFMKNGIIADNFVDLTDRIGDRRSQYAEGRFSIYSYKGRIYALESALTASVYYYQPEIFEAAGVEVPTTWEDALEAGAKLHEMGSAFSVATNDSSFFEMMLQQRGGQIFDKDGNFVLGDDQNKSLALEVADLIQRGVENGTFMVVLGNDFWSGVTIPTAYKEGKLAGQVMPDWWSTCCLKPAIPDMAGKWAVAVPPTWKGGGAGTLVWGGTGFAVNKKSPNAAIALDFIDFMYLGKESQVQRFEKINMFPTMFEAANDPRVTGFADPFYGGQKVGEIYSKLAPEVPVWYQSPFRADFRTATADNLPALFDGSMTPQAFVDEIIRVTQEAIDFAQ